MDTLEARWAKLATHVEVFGPQDAVPRPAVLLFHGCGGIRAHITSYARAAAASGVRAFVIDSWGPRGWSRPFALAAVCTGAIFRGRERAGDVLAALWGVARRPDVDATRLCAAGWSHGGWGIMELMASDLAPGQIGLADPEAADLSGLKSVALVYAYLGIGASRRAEPWRRCPKTLAVIAEQDHLSTVRNARQVYDAVQACGVEVEVWQAAGTHAYDEPGKNSGPMRYDAELTAESEARFRRFLEATLLPQAAARAAPRRKARAGSRSARAG